MLTLQELSQKVLAYQSGQIPLEEFENWFEDNSSGAYAMPDVAALCAAIEAAFSEYYFDHTGEIELRVSLANAVVPFVQGPVYASAREVVLGKPPVKALSANRSISRQVMAAA